MAFLTAKRYPSAGGLAFAIALQKKFPDFDNFMIYEKGSDVGGTWRVRAQVDQTHSGD